MIGRSHWIRAVRRAVLTAAVIEMALLVFTTTRCIGLCKSDCMHGLLMPCVPFLLQLPGSFLAIFPDDWLEHATHWPVHVGHDGLFSLTVAVTQFVVLACLLTFRYRKP